MTFTDDDLKRLKKNVEGQFSVTVHKPTWDEIEALLARLEAAEKVLERFEKTHNKDHGSGCSVCFLMEAWRKAAGK